MPVNASLTDDRVAAIRAGLAEGCTQVELAVKYGTTQGHVSRIKRGASRTEPVRPPITGQRFGRLRVIGPDPESGSDWICQCDCGTVLSCSRSEMERGRRVSCARGCYSPAATHSLTGTSTYNTWKQMRQRCTNPANTSWANYGGRGITVCGRWEESFEAFLSDMGERPDGKSLERLDNDGPYSPENCKWATTAEQSINKRTTVLVTANGVTQSLLTWCEDLGLRYNTVYMRLRRGWSHEKALGL